MKVSKRKSVGFQSSNLYDGACNDYEGTLLLLLKSRLLLHKIVEQKMYLERVRRGNLNPKEICDMLRNQGEDDDEDLILKIMDKRREFLAELRKNSELEAEIQRKERRITLLVHNAHDTSMSKKELQKLRRNDSSTVVKQTIAADKMKLYSQFFYLLQTQPLYLARMINCIPQGAKSAEIMNSIILTLFADGQMNRENYLIITVIQLAIELQMSTMTDLWTAISDQSMIPLIISQYNQRSEGKKFLEKKFNNIIAKFQDEFPGSVKLDLEIKKIANDLINKEESSTGNKSSLMGMKVEELREQQSVKDELKKRTENLTKGCDMFFKEIIKGIEEYPYGLRYLCKVLCERSQDAFSNISEIDLKKYTGYFMYYRFVSNYITSGGSDTNTDFKAVANRIAVNRILYQLFCQLAPFPETEVNRHVLPMNDWIKSKVNEVSAFLKEFIDVVGPEEKLEIDKYLAMSEAMKVSILIKPSEITLFHTTVKNNLKKIAPSSEDPLNKLMNEMGDVEAYTDTKTITLSLEPGKVGLKIEDEDEALFNKTKTMLISVFKIVSKSEEIPDELPEVLNVAEKLATQHNNKTILDDIQSIKENLVKLEKVGKATKEDGYKQLLKEVTVEISNRANIREAQQKELARLEASVIAVRKMGAEYQDTVNSYQAYFDQCVQQQFSVNKKKKKNTKIQGQLFKPKEYSYNELFKKHIIMSSAIPKALTKVTKIIISSQEVGVFNVAVKIPGFPNESETIRLDDLLEMRANGDSVMNVKDKMELNVNLMIYTMNQLMKK